MRWSFPTPAFSLYDTVTRLAGAVPVPVDTSKDGFQLTASSPGSGPHTQN